MRKQVLSLLLTFTISFTCMAQPYNRKKLETAMQEIKLEEALIAKDDWHPYPYYADSAQWDALPKDIRTSILDSANKMLDFEWGYLPANLFLEFHRSGDRSQYAAVSYPRRIAVSYLVLGELLERKGRFMDKIIDGIFVICEESTWDVPAHLAGHRQKVFPDPEDPLVALMSAETASMLAWTDYLIGDQLDEVTPEIRKRLYYEVQRRILTPALEKDDGFWMGFTRKWVNNWNPWVNSNWLMTNLLLEKDPERRVAALKKSLLSLDNFINMYGEDGGCDEGPGYYGHASGSMFMALEIVKSATNGAIDIFDDPLIMEMADYIRKAHIGGPYFVNFADASSIVNPYGSMLYRFGNATSNQGLANMGLYFLDKNGWKKECFPGTLKSFGRILPNLFLYEKASEIPVKYELNIEAWLPDVQVLYARTEGEKELFFSAKGGHNAESHNHNDIGNFIIYVNQKPLVVDIGVETYKRQTFSDERYSIWTMQSQFHNLPTINGVMQMNGADYQAADVEYLAGKKKKTLTLDISKAYPKEAKVNSWRRTFEIEPQGEILLQDIYDIENSKGLEWSFMVYASVEEVKKGLLVLTSKDGGKEQLNFGYDPALFELEIEDYPITDKRLAKVWKDSLIRIKLIARYNDNTGEVMFEFY